MTNLEYYLHDEADAVRIAIVGNLSGASVGSIERSWLAANSVLAGHHMVVGLTALAGAEDDGRLLLLSRHRCGARIIAQSTGSRMLAERIWGPPVLVPPASSGWWQRCSDLLRRWAAAAANRAHAHKRVGFLGAREQ